MREFDDSGETDPMDDPVAALEDLEERGVDDALTLEPEVYREVFTDRRLELFRTVKACQDESLSVTGLANLLDRDKSAVSRDLKTLFEHGVVDFERMDSRKVPVPRHETVLAETL